MSTSTTRFALTTERRRIPEPYEVRPSVFPERNELASFWSLSMTLARAELKQRYFGSVLGYAWTLLRPLMIFGVLYVVFTNVIRIGGEVPNYPLVLLTSLVLWGYFAESTGTAIGALVARDDLMRKVRFPLIAIPLSVVLTTSFHFALNLLVVAAFVFGSGVDPRPEWLLAPILVAVLIVFTASVSLLLATLYVKFRDLSSIWEVISQMLFWGAPIIYTIEYVADRSTTAAAIMTCNPIASVLIAMRKAVLDPNAMSVVEALGGDPLMLLVPIGIVVFVAVLAIRLFARLAPGLAEEL